MSGREFDYNLPQYGLDDAQLSTISMARRWPAWKRREWIKSFPGSSSSPFIYKYLSFDIKNDLSQKKLEDFIVNSTLYLAAPSDFNDPYDFMAYITLPPNPRERRLYFEKSARRVARSSPGLLPHIVGTQRKIDELVRNAMERSINDPELFQDSFERARDHNGVACFSEDPRNMLMWSYYAGGHSGICLQFDTSKDLGVLLLSHKVQYRDELPHLIWPRDEAVLVDKVILNKAKAWEAEKEVRYVSLRVVRDSLPFDGRSLTGIILGTRFAEGHMAALDKLLEKRIAAGLPRPQLYKAQRHKQTYKIFLAKL